MTDAECLYVPRNGWMVMLAQGWRFCGLVVEPMQGIHGHHSVLMERDIPKEATP